MTDHPTPDPSGQASGEYVQRCGLCDRVSIQLLPNPWHEYGIIDGPTWICAFCRERELVRRQAHFAPAEPPATPPRCCAAGPCWWISDFKVRLRSWYRVHPRSEPPQSALRQNYSDRQFMRKLRQHGYHGRWPPPAAWAEDA